VLLRIDINLGDGNHDQALIYGDGINVAARFEALAEPGGVLVSQAIHAQVRDHPVFSD
jgi:adenylate cyclase